MGEVYKPSAGERVRVVYEGSVSDANHIGFDIHEVPFLYEDASLVSIEKIEPPVETFGPGDTVRDKRDPEFVFVIGRDGYLDMYNDGIWNEGTHPFTSENYERVIV